MKWEICAIIRKLVSLHFLYHNFLGEFCNVENILFVHCRKYFSTWPKLAKSKTYFNPLSHLLCLIRKKYSRKTDSFPSHDWNIFVCSFLTDPMKYFWLIKIFLIQASEGSLGHGIVKLLKVKLLYAAAALFFNALFCG